MNEHRPYGVQPHRLTRMTRLYLRYGWRIFRPRMAPWGESTAFWSELDWTWFRGTYPFGRNPATR